MHMRKGQEPERNERAKMYCRGCGGLLPAGGRAHFHKECLRADKSSRTCERRRREQERFHRWLQKRRCANCGSVFVDQRSSEAINASCEASRFTQPSVPPGVCGLGPEKKCEPDNVKGI